MNKKLILIGVGTVLMTTVATSYAAGNTTKGATLTLSVSSACTIDTTALTTNFGIAKDGSLTNAPAGNLNITCPSSRAYGFGVNKGQSFGAGGASDRSAFKTGTGYAISYLLAYSGTGLGDKGLSAVDPGYVVTHTTYSGVTGKTGTGGAQAYPLTMNIASTHSAGKPEGTYSDTVNFVVVW